MSAWRRGALRSSCAFWCFLLSVTLAFPRAGLGQESHEHAHHMEPDRVRPRSAAPRTSPVSVADSGTSAARAGRSPRTLTVGTGNEFATPAAAMTEAIRGDTIRIGPGIHPGGLEIDRRLVLIGDSGAVLDGGGAGTVVTLSADRSVLRGFTVRSGGRSLDRDDAAVKLIDCAECVVDANELPNVLHGIYVMESPDVVITRNDITGDESLNEARRGNGIHVFSSAGARIAGNRIRETRDGVYFSFASNAEVSDNDVSEVRYGLHYMYSDGNRFERNLFRSSSAGAALMFSDSITFRDNSFRGHVGLRAYGILLQTVRAVVAEGNVFAANRIGVHLDNAQASRFVRNVVAGNGIGFELLSSAEGNVFTGNEIRDNRLAVRQSQGTDGNSWSEGGRGNYWASPEVFDLDGDGIGDRPFVVGEPLSVLATRRPALEPFVPTPAAAALAWAERTFPVFDVPRAMDPAPLVRSPMAANDVGAPGRAPVGMQADRRRTLLAVGALGLLGGLAPIGYLHAHAMRARRRRVR